MLTLFVKMSVSQSQYEFPGVPCSPMNHQPGYTTVSVEAGIGIAPARKEYTQLHTGESVNTIVYGKVLCQR